MPDDRRILTRRAASFRRCTHGVPLVTTPEPNTPLFEGLQDGPIGPQYRQRALHDVSDIELFRHAAEAVSVPVSAQRSFDLHAPLELLARQRLLPHVPPADRHLARLRIAELAARCAGRAGTVVTPPPAADISAPDQAVIELQEAMRAGRVERADAVCVAISERFDASVLIRAVATTSLESFGVATHGHIGVHNMTALAAELPGPSLKLARNLVRGWARAEPGWSVDQRLLAAAGTGGPAPSHTAELERELAAWILDLPRLQFHPADQYITNLMLAGQKARLIERALGEIGTTPIRWTWS